MTTIQEIKGKASAKSKYTVFGYLRQSAEFGAQFARYSNDLQDVIAYTCLCYYYRRDPEHFTIHGHGIRIQGDDKQTITTNSVSSYSAYGKRRMQSCNNERVYEWKFRINHIEESSPYGGWIAVGIQDVRADKTGTNFYFGNQQHYGYLSNQKLRSKSSSKTTGTAIKYTNNDTLIMRYDTKQATLSYSVNEKENVIQFDAVKKQENIVYRLVVTLRGEHSSLTLIDYE